MKATAIIELLNGTAIHPKHLRAVGPVMDPVPVMGIGHLYSFHVVIDGCESLTIVRDEDKNKLEEYRQRLVDLWGLYEGGP